MALCVLKFSQTKFSGSTFLKSVARLCCPDKVICVNKADCLVDDYVHFSQIVNIFRKKIKNKFAKKICIMK